MCNSGDKYSNAEMTREAVSLPMDPFSQGTISMVRQASKKQKVAACWLLMDS